MTIDRDTLHLKAHLSLKYAELVYNGMWWSPLRSALDAFVTDTQKNVTGSITMRLYRGSLITRTRNAAHALLDYAPTAHDSADRFDHAAGIGFSYVWSLPIRTFAKTHGPKYLNAVLTSF
jgi:argininosuccinate synthase